MHEIKALVDILKCQRMRDHRININLSLHVPINDLWHIGPATRTAKGRTTPAAPRHQLERAR